MSETKCPSHSPITTSKNCETEQQKAVRILTNPKQTPYLSKEWLFLYDMKKESFQRAVRASGYDGCLERFKWHWGLADPYPEELLQSIRISA